MLNEPSLTTRREDGRDVPVLVWRADRPLLSVSSAPLGGGLSVRNWVVNATVPMSYDRDDPADHLAELADLLGLDGPGVGLLTGVDVAEVVARADTGVRVWATVGLGTPVWAAAAPADTALVEVAPAAAAPAAAALTAAAPADVALLAAPAAPAPVAQRVGTVNVVVYVPARLGPAALVNAVATATEAKAQALAELGVAGTGTPTDAVTVLCPVDGPEAAYGGPRSTWGAPLARAVHAAVTAGGAGTVVPWSDRITA